jgi:hypothetical protein
VSGRRLVGKIGRAENWLQTAYCWYFIVASVEAQGDCFQGETSSRGSMQNTTKRSVSNGADASAVRYHPRSRAEGAGGSGRERPPRGDDG